MPKITKVMQEKGIEEAIKFTEEKVGLPLPEGACLCEADDGKAILMLSCSVDKVKEKEFVDRFEKLVPEHTRIGKVMAKSVCSGNYVRR